MANYFTYQDVLEAYERIKTYIYKTPLEKSIYLGDGKTNYYFKMECQQKMKNFKIRGCLNKMLTLNEEEKQIGVATTSSGNHGGCVAFGAQMLGIKNATIIVPATCPKSKVHKIQFYGGNVVLMGKNYDEAHHYGEKYIEEHHLTLIDSYDKCPKVYAGQGTIAIEIFNQNPEIDTIVIPVGGGGLLTGMAVAAKAIKPSVRIIGVQTAACPALIKSYEDHKQYLEYPNEPSICDALVGGIGQICYEMAKDYVDDLVEVQEATIKKALVHLFNKELIIAEPGSAVTLAAIMEHKERIGGKNVALVLSGGNIDSKLLIDLLNTNQE